ncbi:MAG: hypothetical protein HY554_13965 [Elusimicrobia bacterium]|nr:hypothetical protein [Elusimicrobiota bacterium]
MTSLRLQVVLLSSVEWASAWQRHQAWASRFAAAGHEVFFVEGTGFRDLKPSDAGRVLRRLKNAAASAPGAPPPPGIRVVAPLVLPPTASAFRLANRAWLLPRLVGRLRALGLRPAPLVLAYLPTATTLRLLDLLEPRLVVYDCVDNFEGHPSPPRDLGRTEFDLLRRSALALATSPFLLEKLAERHSNVHELHHGVDASFFAAPGPEPERRAYRSFCYFGSLWHAVDYRHVRALAEAGFSVALLGPEREPPPPLPASVRRLPSVPASRLAAALAEFDGLLLPYADTPYNRGVVPAKTYECLATGKPVLATPIGGLTRFNERFYVESEPAGWVRLARDLPRTESAAARAARVELARRHTTEAQFEKLLALLRQQPAVAELL